MAEASGRLLSTTGRASMSRSENRTRSKSSMVHTVHLSRTASLRKDSMFAPPVRVARRVRDMRCTYCLDAAAVSGSHTRRLAAGHSAEGRGAMSTTSGARASGSTALSLAALWHHSGSAHSYESEPSQNVVMATRRGWPEAAGCELQAASWRVASIRLRRGL